MPTLTIGAIVLCNIVVVSGILVALPVVTVS